MSQVQFTAAVLLFSIAFSVVGIGIRWLLDGRKKPFVDCWLEAITQRW